MGPQENICTHTHIQTNKQRRKMMKEHKRSRHKKFQNFTGKEKLRQVYLKRKKSLCENITQKNVYSYREIERGRRRLRQAAKKSLQVLKGTDRERE